MGVMIPILCGYVTLPLYALVTQMGTSMRKSVFSPEVVEGLKRWRDKARRNLATNTSPNPAQLSLDPSVESCPSFSTLDASHVLDVDYMSDDVAESDGRLDGEIVAERPPVQRGSFEGFDLKRELTRVDRVKLADLT
ncbi:MLO-like protein [Striga asiatica]|uniref:MLO-like protein n=1 Tax=Striga asiatica TaxID=4170 RepID=A0A5A7Q9B4_STRAF|nr:MLO-like protein [Striga asiatica]